MRQRQSVECYQDTATLDITLYTPPDSPGHIVTSVSPDNTPHSLAMAMSGVELTDACMKLYDDIQKGKKFRSV